MWTVRESLTLLAVSLVFGGAVVLAYFYDRLKEWWRRRPDRRSDRR
jgi:hypothetical protein